MSANSPRIRSLLRQAKRVAKSGKRTAAAQLYSDVVEEAPENAAGWLGLARYASGKAQRIDAYEQFLALEPKRKDVQNELALLRGQPLPHPQLLEEDEEETAEKAPSAPPGPAAPITPPIEEKEPAADHDHDVVTEEGVLYCANHPKRETNLRCNKCGKPICSRCAQPTPVGYRCPECIREHQDVFYTANILHYVIAIVLSFPLGLVGGYIALRLGFWVIFLGPIMGSIVGRVVFWAVGRRRGRYLPYVVAGGIIFGGSLPILDLLLRGQLFGTLWLLLYLFTATGAAYYQMK